MKILVLSDSHSGLRFMFRCTEVLKPDVIIHLGDYFDDGATLSEEYPHILFYQVPGNCDRYRCAPNQPEIIIPRIGGLNFYLTHGHRHNVKMTDTFLLKDARAANADVVLYGHTHEVDCRTEEDGLHVMNPGSCGYGGGSAGLIEIENGRVTNFRILWPSNVEEMA